MSSSLITHLLITDSCQVRPVLDGTDEVPALPTPPPPPSGSDGRATVDVIPTASAYLRYVSIEAMTTRASTVIRSMPTSEILTQASTTMPLSRIRSRTSIRLVPPGARSTAIGLPAFRPCVQLRFELVDSRLQFVDLSRLPEGACVGGVETVGAPPVDADCFRFVDRTDDESELNRQQLDVGERDLHVAGDEKSFVEDLVENVDKPLRLALKTSIINRHVRRKISQRLYRSEFQIEIFIAQTECFLQLVHFLFEFHQRVAEALDLFIGQIARVHSPQRLFFEESPDELDDGEHEPCQTVLNNFRVGRDALRDDGLGERQRCSEFVLFVSDQHVF